ncbi:MAG: AAA family ATPase [Firmicutes bacterium]|nr:AAA family ATPase [Bacillota bacterium]
MIIKKLGIRGFGRLKDLEIEFTDGFNIIYGKNEAGKSTVQWFIKGMFYGLRGGREREGVIPPIKRFKPWEGNQYGGFMEYILNDGSFYMVNRNFNDNSVYILDSSFNDITHAFETGRDKRIKFAEKHLGLNETCFEKTLFIKQMEAKVDISGKEEIINKLMNVSETGFEDISFKTAEKALKGALKTYVGTEKSSTRPLDKVNRRLNQLNEISHDLKSKRENLVEIEACLNETKRLMIENKKKKKLLDILGESIKIAKGLYELKKTEAELREIEEDLKVLENESKDVLLKIKENQGDRTLFCSDSLQFSSICMMDRLNTAVNEEEVIGLMDEINSLKDEWVKCKENSRILDEKITGANKIKKILNAGIAISLLFAAGLIAAGRQAFKSGFLPAILPGFGVIIALVVPAILLFLKNRVNKKYLNLKKKKSSLDTYIKNIMQKYDSSRKELDCILESFGVGSFKEFFKVKTALDEGKTKMKEFKTLKQRLKELENSTNIQLKRASYLTNSNVSGIEDLEREVEKIEKDIWDYKARLLSLIGTLKSEDNSQLIQFLHEEDDDQEKIITCLIEMEKNWEISYERAREEEAALTLKLKEYETILNTSDYDDDQLQRTIEEIEELEIEKKKLEGIQFSLSKALEVLKEASLEIQRDYMPALNDRMGYYIKQITGGKYKDLRADDKLMLKVLGPERVDIVPVLQLSGGTIDQMYLALRLAMVDLISQKEESLPLIMDEVFTQFDDVRVEETLKLINEMSNGRQIIMFTCKKREVDIAREICRGVNVIKMPNV